MSDMSGTKKLKRGPEICDQLASQRLACSPSVTEFLASKHGASLKQRVKVLSEGSEVKAGGTVLYWMCRDKRVQDNWALLHAQAAALEQGAGLEVVVCVPPSLGEMTLRHYSFLLDGLVEVEEELASLDIGFHLLAGDPPTCLSTSFLASLGVTTLVTDFSPLRQPRAWLASIQQALLSSMALHQVDAHNVVPHWVTTDKQEYAARTIRPKIMNKLPMYLTPFPPVIKHPMPPKNPPIPADFATVYKGLEVDRSVRPVDEHFKPGTRAGLANLQIFVSSRLRSYSADRNNPNKAVLSNMSPWVNHGQVSMQRAALYVKAEGGNHPDSKAGFIEEAIVRKELSDNFCFHNPHYDSLLGASDWAQKTLKEHKEDQREYLYTREQLEAGETHDDLWNAAQTQLVEEGKLHGFLRMYWAKKILEWTASPEEALQEALRLNDRLALDGNDPNGFVGVMWSIAGLHDQGWAERKVFGKIRYMNYAGCRRKFDVDQFVLKYKNMNTAKAKGTETKGSK